MAGFFLPDRFIQVPPEEEGLRGEEETEHTSGVDEDDRPEGSTITQQFCDDTTCSLQKTKADGVATFEVEAQKVYEVHVLKAPEGYAADDTEYPAPETCGDVTITLRRG